MLNISPTNFKAMYEETISVERWKMAHNIYGDYPSIPFSTIIFLAVIGIIGFASYFVPSIREVVLLNKDILPFIVMILASIFLLIPMMVEWLKTRYKVESDLPDSIEYTRFLMLSRKLFDIVETGKYYYIFPHQEKSYFIVEIDCFTRNNIFVKKATLYRVISRKLELENLDRYSSYKLVSSYIFMCIEDKKLCIEKGDIYDSNLLSEFHEFID